MKNLLPFFLFCILSSCSTIYQPSVLVNPGLKEKGDAVVAVGYDEYISAHKGFIGTPRPGLFAYAAYSPLKSIYLGGQVSYLQGHSDSIGYDKHNSYNIFGGYYRSWGPNGKRLLDIMAGAGSGTGRNVYKVPGDSIKDGGITAGNYWNIFVQPNVQVLNLRDVFSITASVRLNYLHYSQRSFQYKSFQTGESYIPSSIIPVNVLYAEPGVTMKLNFGQFSFFTQGALSLPSFFVKSFQQGATNQDRNLDFNALNIYAGLTFNLNKNLNIHRMLGGNKDLPTDK